MNQKKKNLVRWMPTWRGATNTTIAPGRQKPSRRHCVEPIRLHAFPIGRNYVLSVDYAMHCVDIVIRRINLLYV
jgi:hypothetical protein